MLQHFASTSQGRLYELSQHLPMTLIVGLVVMIYSKHGRPCLSTPKRKLKIKLLVEYCAAKCLITSALTVIDYNK